MIRLLTAAALCAATVSHADVAVHFIEGAPKDRFRIMNMSPCGTGPVDVVIDLSGSSAGLIFDTTASGAGVEVFQPFEIVAGAENVIASPNVSDGDTAVSLSLSDLPADGMIAFTVDVDDTAPSSANGQIRIAGTEIEGARVRLMAAGQAPAEAMFDRRGRTTIMGVNACSANS